MGSRRRALLAGALLAALGGCAADGPEDDGAPPAGTDPPELVSVTVSGGLRGAAVFLAVAADGTVTSGVGTDAPTVEGELTGPEVEELTGLLEGGAFAALPPRTYGSPAPDAFRYTVVHGGRFVMADDTSLTPPLDDIIGLLRPWLSSAG